MNQPLPEIRYEPTEGLTYNPNEAKYWTRSALQPEIDRTFDLCNGCRLCFKYCESFPILFTAIEKAGDVRRLHPSIGDNVIDACFQCKQCYTQCPYTEAEGHAFKLDMPRLLLRANAVRRRERGIPLRERMLTNPDTLGRIGTALPMLANAATRSRTHRVLMEHAAGIHRDARLPEFATETFSAWIRRTEGTDEPPGGTHNVVLHPTCYVQWNKPEIGHAAHRVLRHNDCHVATPGLQCCGMPALDSGDIDAAKAAARASVETLAPWVERGFAVAVVNPTCSMTIRQEHPELLNDPAEPALYTAALMVAAATRDLGEYLFQQRQAGHFNEDFKSTPAGPVAYHAPCHLRAQNIGFRGRDLMRRIPGVTPTLVAECCGHDGTWAIKTEHHAASLQNGRRAFEGMAEADAEVWTTECPLAALQFEQACGRQPLHPVEVLDRAYRSDGFPTPVPAKDTSA